MTEYSGVLPRVSAAAPPSGKSTWSKVIGIISIVFGGLGLLCQSVSMTINAFTKSVAYRQGAYNARPEWFSTYLIVSSVVGIVVSVLLLSGGICLLRRRRSGRSLHVTYGILAIATTIITQIISVVFIYPPMFHSLVGSNVAEIGEKAGTIGGIIFGAVYSLAYPIFLLVWFSRKRIKQEVATWGQENRYSF